jgi:hypothetical protein
MHLDTLIVQLEAHAYPPPERVRNLWPVPMSLATALHSPTLVYDTALDHAFVHRLVNDVLRVLLLVKVQLHADVAQHDAQVREQQPPDPSHDHVLPQAQHKRIRPVHLELRCMRLRRRLELQQRASPDRCVGAERQSPRKSVLHASERAGRTFDNVKVRAERLLQHWVPEQPALQHTSPGD